MDDLIKKAREARKYSYSPYSNFKVGSAIKTKDGKIFTGCNVENASYNMGMCAERIAIFKAVSEGSKEFESIAISSSSNKPVYPCGGCRQVLSEFGDIKIYIDNTDDEYLLSDLLPKAFEKNQMKEWF